MTLVSHGGGDRESGRVKMVAAWAAVWQRANHDYYWFSVGLFVGCALLWRCCLFVGSS